MIRILYAELEPTYALWWVLLISVVIGLLTLIPYFFFPDLIALLEPGVSAFESAFGVILGLLLIFRSNRAYERWWEARTHWGTLMNASRNLAIKVRILVKPDKIEAAKIAALIAKFSYALSNHLKKTPSPHEFTVLLNTKSLPKHVPSFIAKCLYRSIFEKHPELSEADRWLLDRELNQLMQVCGGCEKIKFTLISLSYRILIRHVIIAFFLIMPLSLLNTMGLYSLPVTIIIVYFILALEGIARNLEEPFGTSEDHLNLCEINASLSESVNDILLGEYHN